MKGTVLAAKAVETQGKGTVLATKAVEGQGKAVSHRDGSARRASSGLVARPGGICAPAAQAKDGGTRRTLLHIVGQQCMQRHSVPLRARIGLRIERTGIVLATKAVETQGKGSVLPGPW